MVWSRLRIEEHHERHSLSRAESHASAGPDHGTSWLVGLSTAFAMLIGIPLGIVIAHRPRWNKPVLASANIIQTIPSLALFGFLLPVPWLGARSDRLAILALTLYALLPIIRNTYTGNLRRRSSGRGGGTRDGAHGVSVVVSRGVAAAVSVILSGRTGRGRDFRWAGHDCCCHRCGRLGRIYFSRVWQWWMIASFWLARFLLRCWL